MTVADVIADVMRRAGVAYVFVARGGDQTLAASLSALNIPAIHVPDDVDACVMATVTGRVAGVPGVAIVGRVSAGVLPVLTTALRECAPAIVVAGHEPPTSEVVKAVASAEPGSAAHWVAHAVQAANAEPPGPVWLTVAPGVMSRAALPVATALHRPSVAVDPGAIDEVAAAIARATRPLIVAGRECRAADVAPWLRALAEALPAPTLVTPAARGALPDPHPLCFGLLRPDAAVLQRADLIVALGVDDEELARVAIRFVPPVARLGAGASWSAGRGTIPAEANGAIAPLVEELAPRLRDRARADWDVAELDRIRRASRPPDVDSPLATLVTRLRDATPVGTAIVFAPLLEHGAAHWQAVTPGEVLITERPVAAAAAIALARRDAVVLALPGDGHTDSPQLWAPGIDLVVPSREALPAALDAALARRRASVVVVPLPA